jgi:NAD(P)-dependent dehydrogenase (short-subunit alcohol dehydrogenase family)
MSGELDFIKREIVLSDGRPVGEALADDEWIEEDLLAPVFERTADGRRRYGGVYVELPRGHWKSGGAAAIAVAEAVLNDGTDIVIAAADVEQAGIVLENIEGYLERNPALRRGFKRKRDEFRHKGSRIRVISSDVASSWGLGGTHPSFRVIADELTAWPGERGEQLFTSLVSATGKTPDAQWIVISNAGFDSANSWQFRVRETARKENWALLVTVDGIIASWISEEWVEQQRKLLPGPVFDRVVLNQWTSQSGDFVTAAQWRRCVEPGIRPQTTGVREIAYFGGHDLGLSKDRCAFAIVHLDPQDGNTIVLDELQVWQGSRQNEIEIAGQERALVDAKRRYPRLRIWADPWQFKGSIQKLSSGGIAIQEFTFSAGSVARLSSVLYGVISDASLRVFDDRDLEAEILGLVTVQTAAGWRIDHRVGGFSDRAMALGMAVQEAVKTRRKPGPIWTPSRGETAPAITQGLIDQIF